MLSLRESRCGPNADPSTLMGQLEPAVICRVTSDEATPDDIKKSVVTYEDDVSEDLHAPPMTS
jgi:hypothetical protein